MINNFIKKVSETGVFLWVLGNSSGQPFYRAIVSDCLGRVVHFLFFMSLFIVLLEKCVDTATLRYCYKKAVKGACHEEPDLMASKCKRTCRLCCNWTKIFS